MRRVGCRIATGWRERRTGADETPSGGAVDRFGDVSARVLQANQIALRVVGCRRVVGTTGCAPAVSVARNHRAGCKRLLVSGLRVIGAGHGRGGDPVGVASRILQVDEIPARVIRRGGTAESIVIVPLDDIPAGVEDRAETIRGVLVRPPRCTGYR